MRNECYILNNSIINTYNCMIKSFKEALKARRTFYQISNQSTLSDLEIGDLARYAVEYVPSAFNSQSTRIVLLTGKAHQKLWNIVKDCLRRIVPAEAFAKTEQKIDGSFACGYGTVLYFEDRTVVESLQKSFPAYADNFPIWSQQTNAMHQLVVWTLLEEAGMGASLQHYNPLIDAEVAAHWKLPAEWQLIAQMPFGVPTGEPGAKEILPLDKRVLEFTD